MNEEIIENEVEEGKLPLMSMLIDPSKQLDEAYGYYLEIGEREYLLIKNVKLQGAKKWAEVKVIFNGESREYNFTEFINLLGFKFNDLDLE